MFAKLGLTQIRVNSQKLEAIFTLNTKMMRRHRLDKFNKFNKLGSLTRMKTPEYELKQLNYFSTLQEKKENNDDDMLKEKKVGLWDNLITKYGEHTTHAEGNVNRWKFVPMAVSTHLCLGACYAWSIFNGI